MKWIKFENELDFYAEGLKQGTVVKTKEGDFILVGKINEAAGMNDEYVVEVDYYTEDLIPEINNLIKKAELDFKDLSK